LTITNFNAAIVPLELVIFFEADFLDMFQIRGFVSHFTGGKLHSPAWHGKILSFQYDGTDGVVRRTLVELIPEPTEMNGGQAIFRLRLAPRSSTSLQLRILIEAGELVSTTDAPLKDVSAIWERGTRSYDTWLKRLPTITSDNQVWNDLIDRAR